MENQLIELFSDYPYFAFIFSFLVSILVAVLGVVPSVFITGANIVFFGFWTGTLISFLGEAIGAFVAFYLYRKGFKQLSQKHLEKYSNLKRLLNVHGKEAFTYILSLRLLPFVPSGLITFAASIGKVSMGVFFLASSIGKVPALLMEAYSVYQVTQFGWQGKVILFLIAFYLLFLVWKHKK